MKLHHPNLKNMKLNLRDGSSVQLDANGCCDVPNEQMAQWLIEHGGFKSGAVKAPRDLRSGPTAPKPEGRFMSRDELDSLRAEFERLNRENEELRAKLAEKASSSLQEASDGEGEGEVPSDDSEAASEAQEGSEKKTKKKPRSPKPE